MVLFEEQQNIPQSVFRAKVAICGSYLFSTFSFNRDIARFSRSCKQNYVYLIAEIFSAVCSTVIIIIIRHYIYYIVMCKYISLIKT